VLAALAWATPSAGQQIPMRPGLRLEYAHKNLQAKRERILLIEVLRVTPDEAVVWGRWADPLVPLTPVEEHVSRREMAGARTIDYGRQVPLDTADNRPRTVAMASQRVLRSLRSGATTDATLPFILSGHRIMLDGTMQRVGDGPETLELIVEGAPRKLRTIHARGEFTNVPQGIRLTGDWWFLDDTTDAWMVRNEAVDGRGDSFKMVLASASTASEQPKRLEDELATSCRSTVYGFYFGSGSATLQPASAETFRAVSDVLKKHPDWTLTVEGHTDSIGGAQFNKELSERRAAAVVGELTSKYGIAAGRLKPAGFGLTRPAAPNGTLEGRARNRRVELVRPCTGRS
jgi:outer membrane protein OmpA-like peptidoglycan-associated protein